MKYLILLLLLKFIHGYHNVLLDVASKQKMNIHKLTKELLFAVYNIDPEINIKNAEHSLNKFLYYDNELHQDHGETNLDLIKITDPVMIEHMNNIDYYSQPYINYVSNLNNASEINVEYLYELDNNLTHHMKIFVNDLKINMTYSELQYIDEVNAAFTLRDLSQEIPKNYMFELFEVKTNFTKNVYDFDYNFQYLLDRQRDGDYEVWLNKINSLWNHALYDAFHNEPSHYKVDKVYENNIKLLGRTNVLTGLYVNLQTWEFYRPPPPSPMVINDTETNESIYNIINLIVLIISLILLFL